MREINVSFSSQDLTLAGTFMTPDGAGPFPAALLLPGSGPLDRDGNVKRLHLAISYHLAMVLAGGGWASLRYDKRGVGASEGDYLSAGLSDELTDARAARDWLLARDEVAEVVAIGHSAGALHATELAAEQPAIAGAVLLSTSAKTGEETLRWQARQMGDHLLPAPVRALMRLFRTDLLKQQDKSIAKLKATTTDTARIQLTKVNAKWMREFLAYDPLPGLSSASVPLLAITGSKDVQVDPADLATVAQTAPRARVLRVDDVDHILRHEAGAVSNPRHYGRQVKQPLDAGVITAVLEWLTALPALAPGRPQR